MEMWGDRQLSSGSSLIGADRLLLRCPAVRGFHSIDWVLFYYSDLTADRPLLPHHDPASVSVGPDGSTCAR